MENIWKIQTKPIHQHIKSYIKLSEIKHSHTIQNMHEAQTGKSILSTEQPTQIIERKVPAMGYLKNNLKSMKKYGYLIVNLLKKLNTILTCPGVIVAGHDHFVGENF